MPRETQNKKKRAKNKAKITQDEIEPVISLNMLRFQNASEKTEAEKGEKSKKKTENPAEKPPQSIEIIKQNKTEGNYQLV